jgi:hypothetical protein
MRPSPLDKLIKTPIRVNPLAFSLCGVNSQLTENIEWQRTLSGAHSITMEKLA